MHHVPLWVWVDQSLIMALLLPGRNSLRQFAESGRELASLSAQLKEANAALDASKRNMEGTLEEHTRMLEAVRKVGRLVAQQIPGVIPCAVNRLWSAVQVSLLFFEICCPRPTFSRIRLV